MRATLCAPFRAQHAEPPNTVVTRQYHSTPFYTVLSHTDWCLLLKAQMNTRTTAHLAPPATELFELARAYESEHAEPNRAELHTS